MLKLFAHNVKLNVVYPRPGMNNTLVIVHNKLYLNMCNYRDYISMKKSFCTPYFYLGQYT